MKIEIDVDSKILEELVNNNLPNFDEETLKGLCEQAFVNYLSQPEAIRNILISGPVYAPALSSEAKTIIKNAFNADNEWAEKLRENVIGYLQENYQKILTEAIADSVTSVLFGNGFEWRVREALVRMNNR